MLRRSAGGLVSYHFERLDGLGVPHGVFTRLGGVSRKPFASLNLGHEIGDRLSAVRGNHKIVYQAMGLSASRVATANQVHSNRVVVVDHKDGGLIAPKTDGLVTGAQELALMLRFADCQPILLYDPRNHVLGLVHAGWRGVAQGIARRAVETMSRSFGTRSGDLFAGLGPAIGPCCYTVGQEVAAAMGYSLPDWRKAMTPYGDGWLLDLTEANAQQLHAVGVGNIERADLCTACNTDEFYSHRGEGGATGRFGVVAFLSQSTALGNDLAEERPEQPAGSTEVGRSSLTPPGLPTLGEMLRGRQ